MPYEPARFIKNINPPLRPAQAHAPSTCSLFLCPPSPFIFLTSWRCLTSSIINPSSLSALYIFLWWINAGGHLSFWRNGRFIGSLGAPRSLFVSRLSAEWQTCWRQQSSAKTWSHVFVCACQLGSTAKSWDVSCFLMRAAPTLTPPACFSYPPQPSQPSQRESVPGVCCDLSAPEGGFFKQNKHHSGCSIGGNQALVVKPSEGNVSGFAKFQGARGRLHDSVKPSNKNLTHSKWEAVSVHSKGVFIVAETVMNCKYFWTTCCKYLLIVLPFFQYLCVWIIERWYITIMALEYHFYHFKSGTSLLVLVRGF